MILCMQKKNRSKIGKEKELKEVIPGKGMLKPKRTKNVEKNTESNPVIRI